MRLYDYLPSGNGYKIRLLLTQLALPFERVEVDIVHGASRTPEFLHRNPNGRIPVLELDDGTHLARRRFFVDQRYTVADIALYAYTHVADEGGFDLGRFPAVQAWLAHVREQPGHIPITQG